MVARGSSGVQTERAAGPGGIPPPWPIVRDTRSTRTVTPTATNGVSRDMARQYRDTDSKRLRCGQRLGLSAEATSVNPDWMKWPASQRTR